MSFSLLQLLPEPPLLCLPNFMFFFLIQEKKTHKNENENKQKTNIMHTKNAQRKQNERKSPHQNKTSRSSFCAVQTLLSISLPWSVGDRPIGISLLCQRASVADSSLVRDGTLCRLPPLSAGDPTWLFLQLLKGSAGKGAHC